MMNHPLLWNNLYKTNKNLASVIVSITTAMLISNFWKDMFNSIRGKVLDIR